jgi:hypothetical protein
MAHAKLYLPRAAANFDDAAAYVETYMCEVFGGFTQYNGKGGWKNSDGEIVKEPVRVYETVAEHATRKQLEGMAARVLEKTDESAVMAAVDGEKIIVSQE